MKPQKEKRENKFILEDSTFEICFDQHYPEYLSACPIQYPSGMLQSKNSQKQYII